MLTTEGDLAIGGGGPDWDDPPICDNLGYRVLSIKRAGLLRFILVDVWAIGFQKHLSNVFLNNK